MNVGVRFGIFLMIWDGIGIKLKIMLVIVVNSILINMFVLMWSIIKIIVIIILKIVNSIGLLWMFLMVMSVEGFVVMIFDFCNLMNVINRLIFVLIVNFSLGGMVLMIFLWKFVKERVIKIRFEIKILDKVVCQEMFMLRMIENVKNVFSFILGVMVIGYFVINFIKI